MKTRLKDENERRVLLPIRIKKSMLDKIDNKVVNSGLTRTEIVEVLLKRAINGSARKDSIG